MRPAALTYSKGCVQRSSAITITVVDGLGAPAPWLLAAAALHPLVAGTVPRKEVAGMAATARGRRVSVLGRSAEARRGAPDLFWGGLGAAARDYGVGSGTLPAHASRVGGGDRAGGGNL